MGIFSKIKRHEGKVGGAFYFLSTISVSIISVLSFIFILRQLVFSETAKLSPLSLHLLFLAVGGLFGALIRGRLSVFIHELKHSIVSSLAGNKARGMKIEDESGHFEYAFTKNTSHLNAFISLAPYSFPLFLLTSLPVVALLISSEAVVARALFSTALGLDLLLNAKEISPHQTDFTEVRGGFSFALIYVICFNALVMALGTLFIIYGLGGFLDLGLWMASLGISLIESMRQS